jgi:hypothetical protein
MTAPAFAQAPDPQPPPGDQPPPDTTTTTTSSSTTTTTTGTPPPATGPSTTTSPPIEPPPAVQPESTPTLVKGKTELTFYGFVQLYEIYDSTQGLNEQMQNTALARGGTYGGDHGQWQTSARHSRLGLKIAQPVSNDIKASAQFEMDFLGNQPSNPPTTSESAFYQNGTFRFRHVYAKLETPVVDVLGGQTWTLFGWSSYFHPNSIEIMGLPGQAYKRTAQLRISKTIKTPDVGVELALSAQRPPERASSTPDGVVGAKLTFNKLRAWRTRGANDSGEDAAGIAVSGIGRKFSANEFAATSTKQIVRYGYGVSIDALLPIVPGTKASHGNALTLTGSFVQGAGIADQYDGLTFGVANPALPTPMGAMTAPVYTANIDNGLALFAPDGTLHPIQLQTFMVGAQYYLPPSGHVWLAANYTHASSDNSQLFGAKAWTSANYFDINLFADLTSSVRIGGLFSVNDQTFDTMDANMNTDAKNYRVTGTMLFMF